ncbi:MAG TPA: DUF4349 domain-containing protein [Flavobacterium sp.]|uniref:DUF4349 domain-containing protein n=1 Tax=Flavobacterium sp. TaxID=239 RepID=UPI002BA66B65|nr:DUF4349 domain-containing protein [Flavobacterium sp.]HNP32034.1 DUF4349 domain-containing protein [Flavobacterium sp.]
MKVKVLIYAVIIVLFVCCKKADAVYAEDRAVDCKVSEPSYASVDTTAVEAVDTAVVAAASLSTSSGEDKMDLVEPTKEESIESKIIKSGELRYQTDDLQKTYNQIQAAVKKYKAIIKNDSESNGDYELSRNITIRIPNENFDAFIKEISKGVSYFDRKNISSQDVTEEYIDVASRIKTKKVLEERYFELLKKANKVSEMLEIERQLSEIREEIEAKEGRLKYLQNKVAMSTLDIEFYKPVAQGSKATVSYGGRIGNAIVSGFNGISNFFISLLGIWPVIVTLVVLFVLIRKRFKRKNKKDATEN